MSQALRPAPADQNSPFPDNGWGRFGAGIGILLVTGAILALMGRHFVCPCGTVALWQTGFDPDENSQQFSDWYSLLHIVFGMALFGFVRWRRPGWSLGVTLLAVLFGHSLWEVAENSPLIIGVFSGAANAPDYSGDSILNSLGDTLFALGGAAAMPFLPAAAVAAIVIAAEVAVTWGVGDGFVIGTLRLLGFDV